MSEEKLIWNVKWPKYMRLWPTCPLCKKKVKPQNQPSPPVQDMIYLCTCPP